MHRHTFKMPKVKCLVDCPFDTSCKLLLLDGNLKAGAIDGLPESVQAEIQEQGFTVTTHSFQIQYSQLSSDEVLRVRSAELGRCGGDCIAPQTLNRLLAITSNDPWRSQGMR